MRWSNTRPESELEGNGSSEAALFGDEPEDGEGGREVERGLLSVPGKSWDDMKRFSKCPSVGIAVGTLAI